MSNAIAYRAIECRILRRAKLSLSSMESRSSAAQQIVEWSAAERAEIDVFEAWFEGHRLSFLIASDFPACRAGADAITRLGHHYLNPAGMLAWRDRDRLTGFPLVCRWGEPHLGKKYVGNSTVLAHILTDRPNHALLFEVMPEIGFDYLALAGRTNGDKEGYQFAPGPEQFLRRAAKAEFDEFLEIDGLQNFSFIVFWDNNAVGDPEDWGFDDEVS
jgi:hypothetical protein